ncbi:MAG: cupin domain-containing protein, partial [Clostridia bacterium]|nr:cupin domain-containing protein [Clostridia bacterium]
MSKSFAVLYTAKNDYLPGWSIQKHAHTYHQLMLILSGEAEFVINDRRYSVHAGDCLFFKPGEAHEMKKIRRERVLMLDCKFIIQDPQLARELDAASDVCPSSDAFAVYLD